jgi:hypothetical protein
MRFVGDLIACSRGSRPYLVSSGTQTRDVYPFTFRRPSDFVATFSSLLLDHILHNILLTSLQCSHQLGVPRDRIITSLSLTLDRCGLEGPFPLPRELIDITKPDPLLEGK